MKMINKFLSSILSIILLNLIIPNEYIDNVISGKISDFDKENLEKYNINNEQLIFLNGLLQIDGDKAKDSFVEYFKSNDNIYDAEAAIKIAEYYYSKGSYLQSSDWYKKIPLKYYDSKYLDTAISYYLNSLIIVGKKDTANYYTNLFNKKFKKNSFNENSFIKKKNALSLKKSELSSTYSVQVASFRDYYSAKKEKKILSREGFLCRIDPVVRGSETFYAVRIGNFKNKNLASKEKKRLKYRIGRYDSIIVKIN